MTGITDSNKFAFAEGDLLTSANLIERNVKIFRVGKFTDSAGRESEWTHDDLDKAVENFYALRDANVLPNVPVRRDHTQSIKDVVGYFTHLQREGDFLLADFEWVDETAKLSWDRKQLRNRSLEIGSYTTNGGSTYNPVVLGLAFVDLPAVEGLYRIAEHGEETNMAKTPEEIAAEEAAAAEAAADQAAADQAAADKAAADQAAADQAAADAAAADAAADDDALVGAHRRSGDTHTFRVGGAEVSDFARVQAHIDELETFRTETIQGGRTAFVDGLASDKIITGPQADSFRSLVGTMSNEQFEQFKLGFEGMAPSNLFARHDLGETGGSPAEIDATADRISVLEGIVRNHRHRGASDDEIQKTSSYMELQTLKSATA